MEAGPGRVLTQLVKKILGDRPHVVVACDASGDHGVHRFLQALAERKLIVRTHGGAVSTNQGYYELALTKRRQQQVQAAVAKRLSRDSG